MEKQKKVCSYSKSLLKILIVFLAIEFFIFNVSAFNLVLDSADNVTQPGNNVLFSATITIDENEIIPMEYFTFSTFGHENINCKFLINGSDVSGCDKLDIVLTSSLPTLVNGSLSGNFSGNYYSWGNGTGYAGPSSINFDIILNTTDMPVGTYNNYFIVKTKTIELSSLIKSMVLREPITISDLPTIPTCAFEAANVRVNAVVNGSIKQVWVEKNDSLNITNYDTSRNSLNYYSNLNSSSDKLIWRFVAKDIADEITYGEWQSMDLVKKTKLITDPTNFDGLNGWFVSRPIFTLQNPDATTIYYKWDSSTIYTYCGSFGIDNTPNDGNTSAGILKLTYYADTLCGRENEKSEIIKIDIIDPVIKNIRPIENSVIYTTNPEISAYIDELYFKNSGVNLTSVVLKIDGENVNAILNKEETIDANLIYNAFNLSYGNHEIYLSVQDKAGRETVKTWSFSISEPDILSMTVNSPVNNAYYKEKKIDFNITTNNILEKIEYMNLDNKNPRWEVLCRNCSEYGAKIKKSKNMNEGENNIVIRVTDYFGQVEEENVLVNIESKGPVLNAYFPKKNSYTNGNKFYITYTEYNLVNVSLNIFDSNGDLVNTITRTDCESGRTMQCVFENIDLTQLNGQNAYYQFELRDPINKAKTDKLNIKVDTEPVNLSIESPVDGAVYLNKRVPFKISSNKFVTMEYIDNSLNDPHWKSLCRKCNQYGFSTVKTVQFYTLGTHDIIIRGTDAAGNTDEKSVSFVVA